MKTCCDRIYNVLKKRMRRNWYEDIFSENRSVIDATDCNVARSSDFGWDWELPAKTVAVCKLLDSGW